MKKFLKVCLELVYPIKCPFCGKITGEGICRECNKKIVKIEEPFCMKCGKPLRKAEQEYCYDCKKGGHVFEEGRGLWVHKSPVSDALYAFKYQNRRIYGEIFGRELVENFESYLRKRQIDLIIPIPLYKKKLRKRGYNQAEILARALSEGTGIPMNTRILIRQRETAPQKKLNDKERRKNIRGAFVVLKQVRGKKIVLIDDIYTTGSTLDEAALVLKKAGAQNVCFLTISIGQGF